MGQGRKLAAGLLLLVLAVGVLAPGVGRVPPIDRDEPRYAQATMQMVESGDYLDIRFQKAPRYLQPAGIYWLQAAAVRLTGHGPGTREIWIHRLPSLAGAVVSVLLTAAIGARLWGAEAGVLAGALLAASVLLGFEARLATIDATLLSVILAGQLGLCRVWMEREAARAAWWPALLFWAALGVGLMLKGPVIALVLLGTVAGLCVWARRVRWVGRLRPGVGLLVTAAIALPWFVAIGVRSGGDFFARSVGHNFLDKAVHGQQAHGLPPGYYLVLLPLLFWPGSLVLARGLGFVWRERRDARVGFLLAWAIPSWAVFEAVSTKLPHYVLPVLPALAMLSGAYACSPGVAGARGRVGRWALGAFACVWGVLGVVLTLGLPAVLWRVEGLAPVAVWVLAVAGLAAAGVAGLATLRGRVVAGALAGVVAAACVSVNAYALVLPRLRTVWLSPRIGALVAQVRPCPDAVLASSADTEPSLVFLTGTGTVLGTLETSAAVLRDRGRCGMALVDAKDAAAWAGLVAKYGLRVRKLGEVAGVNVSTGRRLDLTLYAGG